MPGAMYSRWDGTQEPGDLTGDEVLRRLMDDLTEHGDPDQALRRLMQQGFVDGSGRDVAGLRELLDRVRQRRAQLAREAFSELQTAMSNASPAALQHAREMLSELNRLVERRRDGEDVQADFERFMERFGDLVPGHPSNLDELLENMARQVAAARELLESLTPEQRAKLMELSEALLEGDLELRMELESLAAHLAAASAGSPFLGMPLSLEPAGALIGQLSDLSDLEQLLAGAPSPGALAEVDINRARELLGTEDARSLEALGQLARRLRDSGFVEQNGRAAPPHAPRFAPPRGPGPLGPVHQARPLSVRPTPCRPARDRPRACRAKQNPTNGAMRSTCRSSGPCATRSQGADRAHQWPSRRPISRSSAPRPYPALPPSSCSTCRFRCR